MGFLNKDSLRKVLNSRDGQMSLIMILLVAVALLFFAVTLNWAKVSSMKTMATAASNIGAAQLASSMASYGENPVQTSLQGQRKTCAFSAFFVKLLLVFVIIAMIVASIFTAGAAAGTFAAAVHAALSLTTLIISAAAATVALVLQATIIEPGINTMWNKFQANIATVEDRFSENAIQTALERAVTDPVRVNDISDYDMDGKWCKNNTDLDCPKIARFAYYYTKRMLGIPSVSTDLLNAYKDFRSKLGGFIGGDLGVVKRTDDPTDGTYVYQIDDTCCVENNKAVAAGTLAGPLVVEQYCNSCCVTVPLREPLCGVGGTPINDTTLNDLLAGTVPPVDPPHCDEGPYQGDYPLSYDSLFCMRFHYQRNGYVPPSGFDYAAVMGVDDSVPSWSRLLDRKPNWPDLRPDQGDVVSGEKEFHGKDSEGRFFPLLWFMRDTRTKIKDLTYDAAGFDGCHWCKDTAQCLTDAIQQGLYWVSDPPLGYSISAYVPAPTAPTDDLKCVNRFEGYVNNRTTTEEFPGRQIDNVEPFYKYMGAALKEMQEKYLNGCPGDASVGGVCNAACPPCAYEGSWRTGNDRYCSNDMSAPYYSGPFSQMCAKFDSSINAQCYGTNPQPDTNEPEIENVYSGSTYNSATCSCTQAATETAKEDWRDDEFDLVIQKMSDLADTTRLVLIDKDNKYYNQVDQWGQQAQHWLADINYVTSSMIQYKSDILGYLNGGTYASDTCYTSAWCVPTVNDVNAGLTDTFVGVSKEELIAEFFPSANYGTFPSVMQCLAYNLGNKGFIVSDQTYFNNLSGPYGMAMNAKNTYLACAYPLNLNGYEQVGGTPGVYNPLLLPAYPLVPMPINGQCGLNCSKGGNVIKDPAGLPCKWCGMDCWRPAGYGTQQCIVDSSTLAPVNTCPNNGGCGGTCPKTCSGALNTCSPLGGCGGTCPMTCNIAGKCGAPCGACVGVGCTGTCGYWTCPGVCGYWTCTHACGLYHPENKCSDMVTFCQDAACPTYCQGTTGAFAGIKVDPQPAYGCYPRDLFPGMCNGQCGYTNDCSDQYAQWATNKKNLADQFYMARHGTTNPVPPSPGYNATGGFMMDLERNWHRTLSTKTLYDNPPGVPGLTINSASIGGNAFSKTLTAIRGWDTDKLVGTLGDDCEYYYNYCRPIGAVTPADCADRLPLCLMDPVFVQDFLPDSALLAGRQAPKLTKRQQYLQLLIDKATALANALPTAATQQDAAALQQSLDHLIQVNDDEKLKPPILPNWASYVWQSPPPKGETEGYWHAVKVEALLPKRCYVNGDQNTKGVQDYDKFDCCASGENKDKFPWIRVYNTHWMMRRCYEMWDENGCVKVRVSRFDEDHSLQGSVIKFLNGLPLWKFLYRHPLHAGDPLSAILTVIGSKNCAAADDNAAGAYMSNSATNTAADPNASVCYPAVEALIHQGFISETCARYELEPDPTNSDKWTYNIIFRDCKSCCRSSPEYHKLQDD